MNLRQGLIEETYLLGERAAKIRCPEAGRAAPGQYLLAWRDSEPDSPLPHPVFVAGTWLQGFYAAAPLPAIWGPGTTLTLRGPLGTGFQLPAIARRVALIAPGAKHASLLGLVAPALTQKAAVALCCDHTPTDIPSEVEILPLSALRETAAWADYLALETARDSLAQLPIHEILSNFNGHSAEALIHTPVACGGIAECAACALETRQGWRLACKDGPVFPLKDLKK